MSEEHYIGGFHAVMAALEHNPPSEILLLDSRKDERARKLNQAARARGVRIRLCQRSELDLLGVGLKHQGVLARVQAQAPSGEALLTRPAPTDGLILALDGVQDPHNLGACLRTAEAAGAQLVIVPRDRAAGLTPVARKAAAGAAERLPVSFVTNLSRTLTQLRERGYWLTGLAGQAEISVHEADFRAPTVLVMGAEAEGLRRLTRETCDQLVRIPMREPCESLNVSVAAAVCLYEVVRQRCRP